MMSPEHGEPLGRRRAAPRPLPLAGSSIAAAAATTGENRPA